jgi:hypothetical protein
MHQCVSIWRLNIVSLAIGALNGIGQTMLEVAQPSKEESSWAPLLMAAAGFLLSLIIFIINQQISGWANQLFGGIGFSTRTADRMAGAAGRQLGRNLSNAGKTAGTAAGKAGWRGLSGGHEGGKAGFQAGGLKGMAKGGLQGAYRGIMNKAPVPKPSAPSAPSVSAGKGG